MMRRTRTAAAAATAALAVVTLAACGSTSGAPTPTMSPKALVASALRNADNGVWVHEVSVFHGSGHSLTMVNDVGTNEGRQVIDSNGARATVLVIDGVAYIDADAQSLSDYFGLAAPAPQRFADQWIAIPPSAPTYFAPVSASVTLTSDFGNLQFTGPFTIEPGITLDGTSAVPIAGHMPGPSTGQSVAATLYVTGTGKVLPLELSASHAATTYTVTWGDWGRGVTLTVPATAVPISTVVAAGAAKTTA